jgi:uncharacterized membrane protein
MTTPADVQTRLRELDEKWGKLWDNVFAELEVGRVVTRQILHDAHEEAKRTASREMSGLFMAVLEDERGLREAQGKEIQQKLEELLRRIEGDSRIAHRNFWKLTSLVAQLLSSWTATLQEMPQEEASK